MACRFDYSPIDFHDPLTSLLEQEAEETDDLDCYAQIDVLASNWFAASHRTSTYQPDNID